jgi:hypothetical protein
MHWLRRHAAACECANRKHAERALIDVSMYVESSIATHEEKKKKGSVSQSVSQCSELCLCVRGGRERERKAEGASLHASFSLSSPHRTDSPRIRLCFPSH